MTDAPRRAPNRCPDGDAMDRIADSMERIATSLDEIRPGVDVIRDLADRLDRLCNFLRRRGPWILALLPTVAVAVGAISPEVGNGIKAVLAAIAAS